MERRTLLKALGALAVAPLAVPSQAGVYGYMDVDRWFAQGFYQRGAKVLLDGVDITYGCRWFNDVTGEAECLVYGVDGQVQVNADGDGPAEILKRGQIQVVDPGSSA